MDPTADDCDVRVERLTGHLPVRMSDAVTWLRKPSPRPVRLAAALALIGGGALLFLPVPRSLDAAPGVALLSEDIPALKPRLEASARAVEGVLSRFRKP